MHRAVERGAARKVTSSRFAHPALVAFFHHSPAGTSAPLPASACCLAKDQKLLPGSELEAPMFKPEQLDLVRGSIVWTVSCKAKAVHQMPQPAVRAPDVHHHLATLPLLVERSLDRSHEKMNPAHETFRHLHLSVHGLPKCVRMQQPRAWPQSAGPVAPEDFVCWVCMARAGMILPAAFLAAWFDPARSLLAVSLIRS